MDSPKDNRTEDARAETNDTATKVPRNISKIVYLCFIAAVVIILLAVFLLDYSNAYSDDTGSGGFIPRKFGVIFAYLRVSVIAFFAAILIKSLLYRKIKLRYLLLCVVILPVICYNLNYHTLKRDGIFFPLVSEGGIFHFIVIGDFNFDGMNDEEHYRLYEERECITGYGGDLDDPIIKMVDTKAVGTGAALDGCFCSSGARWKERILQLNLRSKNNVTIKEIEIKVKFKQPNIAENIKFYIHMPSGEKMPIEHTVDKNGCAVFVVSGDVCSMVQESSEKEYIVLPIEYVIQDGNEAQPSV